MAMPKFSRFDSFYSACSAVLVASSLWSQAGVAQTQTRTSPVVSLAQATMNLCSLITSNISRCRRVVGGSVSGTLRPVPMLGTTTREVRGDEIVFVDPEVAIARTNLVQHPAQWNERRALALRALSVMPQSGSCLPLFRHCQLSQFEVAEWDLLIDALVGLDPMAQLEQELRAIGSATDRPGAHVGASPYGLWTPYRALSQLFEGAAPVIPRGARVADLGSGLGRIGMYLALVRPDLRVVGYEFDESRAAAANAASNRFGLPFRTVLQDLSIGDLPSADVYYLFNPFDQATTTVVSERLRQRAVVQPFAVISFYNVAGFGSGQPFGTVASGVFEDPSQDAGPWLVSRSLPSIAR